MECDQGSGFLVSKEDNSRPAAIDVLGKTKCCWSRSAPIVYAALPLKCPNTDLPQVFHGSQWASLHHTLVEHMIRHPIAQRITAAMENTLLPDEAMLQTIAVNSPFRETVIPSHLRFIEWCSLHSPLHPCPLACSVFT